MLYFRGKKLVFSSFSFLCFFLPAVLLLNLLLKDIRLKNGLLIVASLFFYAYGEPVYCVLLLFSVIVNYYLGRMADGKNKKVALCLAVIFNIGLLFVFKYLSFILGCISDLTGGLPFTVSSIRLPIGISFYTFQALSYVIDVYRGNVKAQKSFPHLLLYISFFPQLIAGPIVKYHDIEKQITVRKTDVEGIRDGIFRFTCGLAKKILIANVMAEAADALFSYKGSDFGLLSAWLAALSYLMQIYFDFSGYSDMALGLGLMFGFRFRENFLHPYVAGSIKDFWRRWHISLSSWFKEYLYIPLGGNRKGKLRTLFNRYAVFILTGIWHGANWTFLFWGLWHGTFLVIERCSFFPFGKDRKEGSWLRIIDHVYTLLVVTVGFVIFRAENLGQAFGVIRAMFGFGSKTPLSYTVAAGFLAPFYILIFVLAIALSTEYPLKLAGKIRDKKKDAAVILSMAGSLLLLFLCYLQLASDSYNPFIYFRF